MPVRRRAIGPSDPRPDPGAGPLPPFGAVPLACVRTGAVVAFRVGRRYHLATRYGYPEYVPLPDPPKESTDG